MTDFSKMTDKELRSRHAEIENQIVEKLASDTFVSVRKEVLARIALETEMSRRCIRRAEQRLGLVS